MAGEPKKIGRYKVQGVLGRGAMGTVYLAQDPKLMRQVAIKVVRDPQGDASQIMMRFQREAVISAKLNHPHIITIFDVGEDPVLGPFMAMEYVDGAALTDLVREKLPLETGLRLLAQTMSALMASEAEGISHRDVKPDNILVSKDWRVKLMDFGIAKGNEARLTQAGMVFGTPFYTAPEVLVGGEASSVSDRYSFTVTAFEVISGVLPFHGSSVGTVVYRIVNEPPEMPDSFNPALRTVFELALAKDPAARFPDLLTFMEALLEAVDLPEEQRSRLQHYVSDLRSHASAPPMEITQNLDVEKPPHSRTTEVPGTPIAVEEDPFDGPSYQTIMIPVLQPEPPATQADSTPEELEPSDAAEEVWMDSSHILPPEQTGLPTSPAPIADARAASEPETPGVESEPTPITEASAETVILPVETSPAPITPPQAEPAPTAAEPAPVELVPMKTEALPDQIPTKESESTLPTPSQKPRKPSSFGYWAAGFLILGFLGTSAYYLLHLRSSKTSRTRTQSIVSITSNPAGATIYLDGQQAGKTPVYRMQLDGMKHSMRVELPGYQVVKQEIQAGDGKLHFSLKPAGNPVSITSDPSGAEVFLNDQSMGITPLSALVIPSEGRQELILKHSGYLDWQAIVDPDLPLPDPIRMNPAATRRRKSP